MKWANLVLGQREAGRSPLSSSMLALAGANPRHCTTARAQVPRQGRWPNPYQELKFWLLHAWFSHPHKLLWDHSPSLSGIQFVAVWDEKITVCVPKRHNLNKSQLAVSPAASGG